MEHETVRQDGSTPQQQFWQELSAWGELLVQACLREQTEEGEEAQTLRSCARQCWAQLEERSRQAAEEGVFLPFPYVTAAFDLEDLESRCLALALLPESQRRFETLYSRLEPTAQGALTADLALRLLEGNCQPTAEELRCLSPGGPLLRHCMEEAGFAGRSQLSRVLRPCQRVVDFILCCCWEEPGHPGLSLWQPEEAQAPPEHLARLAERMDRYISADGTERTTFFLQGQPGAGRSTLARTLAAGRNQPLLFVRGRCFTEDGGGAFRELLLREALLQRCPVCFTGLEGVLEEAAEDPETEAALVELLQETAALCGYSLVISDGDWIPGEGPVGWRAAAVTLALPTLEESRALWSACLDRYPLAAPQDADALAGKYRFTPGQMNRALEEAAALARWEERPGIDDDTLAQGCRRQVRHALGERARKVEAAFGWEDLILPAPSKALLRSACDQMQYRRQVYDSWGFGGKLSYGTGLSLLFAGPPGTGKTMAAQIVAGQLGLDLYKVELPAVVSKYVGETEKNLREIFREASRSQAILFFDEADVLFGKRTEVKDSHDKYSNMEAAYLLQKMEEYAGVSVLATNFLQNFDEAFKRRLKFLIDFPLPDQGDRLRLWHSVIPARTPLAADVDWDYLATQFELSGSAIKNVALNAAFLAAKAGEAVGMAQLLTALKREMRKSGKSLTREDFGEYYMLVEQGDGHGTV